MGIRLTDFSYAGRSLVREVFIETGTYLGETLEAAAGAGFGRLYSIECVPGHHARARERLGARDNVILILGSSPDALPAILDRSLATTFWLDAHYQGGPTHEQDPKYGQCPLLAELRAIFAAPWAVPPALLIDDAHMFMKPVPTNFEAAEWPTLRDIRAALPAGYAVAARIAKNRITEGPWVRGMADNVIYCIGG